MTTQASITTNGTDICIATRDDVRTTSSKLRGHLQTAGAVALGLPFVLFGLNGFLYFLPPPPPDSLPPGALAFSSALAETGYMLPLISGVEIACGLLLLSRRFVPLALVVLAPLFVNILAFHAFLSPAGSAIPSVLVAIELALAWSYRSAFRPLLRARAT